MCKWPFLKLGGKALVCISIESSLETGLFRFAEDGQWYRASVLAYASEESVLVGYVDYGNFEILSLKRLCPITPKLLELPMQAIKCVLTGTKFVWSPHS